MLTIALNTPIKVGAVTTEVGQSADTKRYSFTAVGGTTAEQREAAENFFSAIGREMGDGYAVTRPWGTGLLFGEARPARNGRR